MLLIRVDSHANTILKFLGAFPAKLVFYLDIICGIVAINHFPQKNNARKTVFV